MKQQQLILIGIIVLAVVGGGILLFSKGQKTESSPTETTLMTTSPVPSVAIDTTTASPATTATKTFTVTGANYSYDVKEMKVKKGDTVTVLFKNAEGFHDWNLDEFAAHTKKIQAGAEETVSFVASKTGTFEYYCSVGNHRQMGMKGNLIVE
jgi:plastocyanin